MIERLCILRPAIDDITCTEEQFLSLGLSLDSHDWYWLKQLGEVLGVFVEATSFLSAESYPTLFTQYPYYALLTKKLNEIVKVEREQGNDSLANACAEGWKKLNDYHVKADQTTPPSVAVLLDPRVKTAGLKRLGWTKKQIDRALKNAEVIFQNHYNRLSDGEEEESADEQDALPQSQGSASEPIVGTGRSDYDNLLFDWSLLEHEKELAKSHSSNQGSHSELKRFLALPVVSPAVCFDILTYFNGARLLIFYITAFKFANEMGAAACN